MGFALVLGLLALPQDADLDRLLKEAAGSSELRRRMACRALAAYGRTSLEWLKEKGVDSAVLEAVRAAQPPSGDLAPVRIGKGGPWIREALLALEHESPEMRASARERLKAAAFGAERALWEALDSQDATVRAEALDLLSQLYPVLPVNVPVAEYPASLAFHGPGISVNGTWQTTLGGIQAIMKEARLSFVLDDANRAGELRTWGLNARPSTPKDLMALVIRREWTAIPFERVVLVVKPEWRCRSGQPVGPFWVDPKVAGRIGSAIEDLVSDDRAAQGDAVFRLMEIGEVCLGPVRSAMDGYPPEVKDRLRSVHAGLMEHFKVWYLTEALGAELQTLREEERRILDRAVTLCEGAVGLAGLLEKCAVKGEVRAGSDRRFALTVSEAPIATILKGVTRPYGLDFCFQDGALVIDTRWNIRAIVEGSR